MAKSTINSDIYNLSSLINDVKSIFLPNETEETLAISTYGYIGALESQRLQTQVQMTGELCNEVFPSRARLERNIITHAIMANIENINAIPAKITAFLAIKESDIQDFFNPNTNIFVLDRECPIMIGDFEFHLEYDIKLKKIKLQSESQDSNVNRSGYAYTAQYDIPPGRDVPTSSITSATEFLNPPTVANVDGEYYIYLTVLLAQVEHSSISKKLITSNIIDNKTMNIEFENQLAYFEVHSMEPDEEYYLTPVFEGSSVPMSNGKYYCWYQYIDTNNIRIRFDRRSYMPGLNATVECLIKTCQGSSGNFKYRANTYITLSSSKYGYKNINCILSPLTDSANGKDRKSIKELQSLIPKESLSRGSITTITDLNNYFNMINSDIGKIVIQKKIDNQIERIYYAYLLAKDMNNNIIPSNTVDLKIRLKDLIDSRVYNTDPPRFILPAGSCFKLGPDNIAYINDTPILDSVKEFTPDAVTRGQEITADFAVEVISDEYDPVSCGVDVGGNDTNIHVFPKFGDDKFVMNESSNNTVVEDYLQMGVGQTYTYTASYTTQEANTTITAQDLSLDCLDFIEGYYVIDEKIKSFSSLPVILSGIPENTKITFYIKRRLNTKASGIVYFGSNRKFETPIHKFNQTKKGKLSDILRTLGISGEVIEASSGEYSQIRLTENGTIVPTPIVGRYTIRVVDEDHLPSVYERNENEWFYVIQKTTDRGNEELNTDTEERVYTLIVCTEADLPPVEERLDNTWYYVITRKEYRDETNPYPNSDTDPEDMEYVLHVKDASQMPPIDEREINNWWYSIYHRTFRKDIPDLPTDLTGKEYDVEIISNFHKETISFTVQVDAILYTIYVTQDRNILENGIAITDDNTIMQNIVYTTYIPTLDQNVWPTNLVVGDIINYKVRYKSSSSLYKPKLAINLSRGLRYIPFSNKVTYPDGRVIQLEPSDGNVNNSDQFLYTNPYTININGHRLYSSFYMMSMNENPYLHFDYINDSSDVQFIATNVSWNRPLIGDDTKQYTLSLTLTQSVQNDLGLLVGNSGDINEYTANILIKVFAVFYRNGKPYRYRSMGIQSYNPSKYSYTFSQTFKSEDIFDNENNLQLINVQNAGQSEFETTLYYGDKSYTLRCGDTIGLDSLMELFEIETEEVIENVTSQNNSVLGVYRKNIDSEYQITAYMDFPGTMWINITDLAQNVYTIYAESKGPRYYRLNIYQSKDSVVFEREFNMEYEFRASSLLSYFGIVYDTISTVVFEQKDDVYVTPVLDSETGDIIDFNIRITGEIEGKVGIDYDNTSVVYNVETTSPVYGFFEPNSEIKIYTACAIPDISGEYSKYDLNTIVPGLENWTLTNVYGVVNGITMYHNYSEIMGSKCTPYGKDKVLNDDLTILDTEGYYVKGVPMFGFEYCQDDILAQDAIQALNYRKAYIDRVIELLENSFGIDFKLFNTYGPSKVYYIIKDQNLDSVLNDKPEPIGRVNLTLNFRIKLVSTHDSYTRDNIIKDIKEYMEDFEDISELHIPNLITEITNKYREQINYIEFLGFNNFGADVQHIYKTADNEIPISVAPEFLNVNNVLNKDGTVTPDINIYVSEM